jgi:NADH-quinone oxidoreductase subunit L
MWVPLVVLAVLATIGGFVGISTAFTGGKHVGGRLNIVNWMKPIIWEPTTHESPQEVEPGSSPVPAHTELVAATEEEKSSAFPQTGFNLAHAIENKFGSEIATEWLFIILSLAVAGTGIGLGLLFYVKDTSLPDIWAERLRPLYEASYHKYWVDEFYGWAITRRTMDAARAVFAFDSKVIDGGVNGSAWLTRLSSRITGVTDQYFVDGLVNAIAAFIIRLMSPLLRAAQTGFTQNYALVMVLGLVAAVAIFFGPDIFKAFKGFFAIGF